MWQPQPDPWGPDRSPLPAVVWTGLMQRRRFLRRRIYFCGRAGPNSRQRLCEARTGGASAACRSPLPGADAPKVGEPHPRHPDRGAGFFTVVFAVSGTLLGGFYPASAGTVRRGACRDCTARGRAALAYAAGKIEGCGAALCCVRPALSVPYSSRPAAEPWRVRPRRAGLCAKRPGRAEHRRKTAQPAILPMVGCAFASGALC